MARDDMFHDRETKAGAAFGPALAGIDPVETFGQPRQMFGRNAWAVVANASKHTGAASAARLISTCRLTYLRIGSAIFDRVFDEIFGHPQQLVAVAGDDGLGRNVEFEGNIVVAGHGRQRIGDVTKDRDDIDRRLRPQMQILLDPRQ